MAKVCKVGTPFVMWHGVLMLGLGIALFFLGSLMTTPRFEASGYIAAVFLTAACLLAPAMVACVRILENAAWRSRRFYVYLLAGMPLMACWLVYWLRQSDPLDINLLGLLAGLHGIFWGVWYARLAFHLKADTRKAAMLCILAGTTSAIGIVLAARPQLTTTVSVTAVACYAMFLGVQILLTAPYLFRSWENGMAEEVSAGHLAQAK